MPRPLKEFTREFKCALVEQRLLGEKFAKDLAAEAGITPATLAQWKIALCREFRLELPRVQLRRSSKRWLRLLAARQFASARAKQVTETLWASAEELERLRFRISAYEKQWDALTTRVVKIPTKPKNQ